MRNVKATIMYDLDSKHVIMCGDGAKHCNIRALSVTCHLLRISFPCVFAVL